MKLLKKLSLPLLLLSLVLSLNVSAAEQNSPGNFIRTKSYSGQFSDLSPDSVFYDNISALYEYGLSIGKTDGTFGITDQLSVGQIVIFSGRIRSIYEFGEPEQGADSFRESGMTAAQPYLLYLKSRNIVEEEFNALLAQPATRAQVAHLLAKVLPAEALPTVHAPLVEAAFADPAFLPDLSAQTPYLEDILTLYAAGISIGSDACGTYYPDAAITRGAAAAMLTRIVDPALRKVPDWNPASDAEDPSAPQPEAFTPLTDITLADLVAPGVYYSTPADDAQLDSSIRDMLSRGSDKLELKISDFSHSAIYNLMNDALEIVKLYCEQCYNCAYSSVETSTGTATFHFSAVGAADGVASLREATMEYALDVYNEFHRSGVITSSMTDREKARIYFDWVVTHCEYDDRPNASSLSHIPWSLFARELAVCDGYTGALNLFLKLEGIPCIAFSNESHIWTVAELDGTIYHLDPTWGDAGDHADDAYFCMTAEQSWAVHPWQ